MVSIHVLWGDSIRYKDGLYRWIGLEEWLEKREDCERMVVVRTRVSGGELASG